KPKPLRGSIVSMIGLPPKLLIVVSISFTYSSWVLRMMEKKRRSSSSCTLATLFPVPRRMIIAFVVPADWKPTGSTFRLWFKTRATTRVVTRATTSAITRFRIGLWKLWHSLDGYGIEGFWLGFGALTRATTGSMMGATTGSEFGIGFSTWTTEVLRKDLSRIRGTRGSASKSTTMKSAEKWNVPTLTKTSSATPTGREIERSASLRVIHVGDSS
nr:hypothetical protein [Tanacetum cinerariifolium]